MAGHRSRRGGVATTMARHVAGDRGGCADRTRRRLVDGPLDGVLQAAQRLGEPPFAGERPGQPGQVTRGRGGSCRRVGEPRLEMGEEPAERADVLVVVPDDVGQRGGVAAAQELEVATGDLGAIDVTDAVEAEQLRLRRTQPRVAHPVAEQPPDDRQQVEVAGMGRRVPPGQAVAGDEQRPVEGAAVVGDEPGVRRDQRRERGEEGPLLAVVGQEQLDLAEAVGLPPAEADEERGRTGRRGQPGRLGIEADEGDRGAGLPGQGREAGTVDRERPAGGLAADDDALRSTDELAPDRVGQSLGKIVAARRRVVSRRCSRRGPIALEPAREGHRRVDHRARSGRRDGDGRPEVGEQTQREGLGVDMRFETRAGAGGTAGVAVAGRDQVGRTGQQLVVPLPEPFRQADPARHRLVQVDRRRLVVRRADLARRGRGRAGRPSAAPRRRSGSPGPAPGRATSSSSRRQWPVRPSAVSQ